MKKLTEKDYKLYLLSVKGQINQTEQLLKNYTNNLMVLKLSYKDWVDWQSNGCKIIDLESSGNKLKGKYNLRVL